MLGDLTERETECLKLISEGYSNNEIAKKMGISITTMRSHFANIMQKYNLTMKESGLKPSVSRIKVALKYMEAKNSKVLKEIKDFLTGYAECSQCSSFNSYNCAGCEDYMAKAVLQIINKTKEQ